jgi:phosphoserine aminotransferase
MTKPAARPKSAHFSSGPCAKRPGWTPELLKNALVGRSHRSKEGKQRLIDAIELHRELLEVPGRLQDRHRAGLRYRRRRDGAVVDAGRARRRHVLAWESFGEGWVTDVVQAAEAEDVRTLKAAYGEIPDLKQVDFDPRRRLHLERHHLGRAVPNGDWISDRPQRPDDLRRHLGGVRAWTCRSKLDVVTFSWQKALGGEAAHGMLDPEPACRASGWRPTSRPGRCRRFSA